MPIATGVFKKLAIKKQAALGTTAPAGAAGTARYMRRVSSTLDLAKAAYTSAEILESQQRRDMRHGVRSVAGSISGELSVGGYQSQFESVLRAPASVAANTGAAAIIFGATSDGAGTFTGTFTRSGGSFLTDGFKVGDVVRPTGFATTGVANNTKNFLITSLTALVMGVRTLNATDVAVKAAGDSVVIAVAGRKVSVPVSGHTRDYYTIEHFFADIGQSELFKDCVFTGATISLPATGLATVEFPVMGLDMTTGAAEYFTAPAASPIGPIVAAVNGVLIVGGVVVANITGLTVTIAGNYSVPGGVVGANTDPDIFPGPIDVTGSLTVLFVNGTLRDQFLNETEGNIVAVLTGSNIADAPFVAFNMPRTKLGGATKDDGNAGLSQTMPFTALENTAGGVGIASLNTTLSIQDSAFV